jgi:hypothetical protein
MDAMAEAPGACGGQDMKDLHVRLPDELAEKIIAMAKENERSVSAQVTFMLKRVLPS